MTQQHQEKDELSSFGFIGSRHFHCTTEFFEAARSPSNLRSRLSTALDPERFAREIDAYHVISEETVSQEAIGAFGLNKPARSQLLRAEVPTSHSKALTHKRFYGRIVSRL